MFKTAEKDGFSRQIIRNGCRVLENSALHRIPRRTEIASIGYPRAVLRWTEAGKKGPTDTNWTGGHQLLGQSSIQRH